MSASLFKPLSMTKYAGLINRQFADARYVEIRATDDSPVWQQTLADDNANPGVADKTPDKKVRWASIDKNLEQRRFDDGLTQYRAPIVTPEHGAVGWLIVSYATRASVPLSSAPELVQQVISDLVVLLGEELALQHECNQLATELTARYEELNVVYSTKDHVEYPDEGQQALSQLVRNCADYIDAGFAMLVCRERGLFIHSTNDPNPDLQELIGGVIYDRIEAQVSSVIVNTNDDADRKRLLADRDENLLAHPIVNEHGIVIGIIAVVTSKLGHEFTNGDRNLLEVMTRKASRIIHTHHDSLTGLMNRSGFEPTLVSALASAKTRKKHFCLLHIDIDQLRVVNDLMGRAEGDAIIRRVAKTLRSSLRDSDMIARIGDDEFSVLLPSCEIERGRGIADKLRAAINEIKALSNKRQLDISASVGVACIDADTDGIVEAVASAELACQAAKERGGDAVQIFAKEDAELVQRSGEALWIGRIQEALRDNQFTLYCQPVTPLLEGNHAQHFEILIRLLEDGEPVAPGQFMPAAERYHLMPQIDRWVIRNTLASIVPLAKTIHAGDCVFCINLSGQSLTNSGFTAFVIDEINRSPISAHNICFEVTETAAIANMEDAIAFISQLRALGCKFALDDFGAGLSSFGYLKQLPVDYLKIDGSFVRELTTDPVSLSMVKAMCEIGRTMNLSMIAEFVGDAATVELLQDIAVDYGQGYFLGKPIPLTETLEGLRHSASASSA